MDEELFREEYQKDLLISEKMCEEIDYKLRQLGNLENPHVSTVKAVVKECTNIEERSAFLFFARAFGYVPHPTRGKVSMSESMYSWQKIAAVKFLTGTRFISKKVRQIGATTFVSTYFLWRALFYGNTNSFILSLGSRESTDVLSRVTFMYNNLPTWLKTPLLEGAKTSIMFKNNSKVTALPGTPDALRGRSSTSVILDEFAFLNHADKILSAAVPSLSMGFLTPFSNSTLPSQLFIISTFPLVESDNNEYVRLYKNSINGDSDFKILSVFTDDIPEYSDQNWRKSMLETLGPKKYAVEIEGKMNLSMDNSFFPEYIIAELKALQPIRMDFLKPSDVDEQGYPIDVDSLINAKENYDQSIGYIKGLWVWVDPIPKKEYGITVDVAAGVGNDYSAIQIIDLEEGEQVAEYYSNKISLEDFKSVIWDLTKYYNNAKLSIERNSLGAPICSYFYQSVKYENFYLHRKSKTSFVEGFPVTGGNRGSMLANLQSALIKKEIKINSIRTINEIRTFAFLGNGKLGASQGNHDDLILALAQYSFLRQIFFNTQSISEYGDDFMKRVEREAEIIRRNHFSNDVWSTDSSRERELKNLFAGYSIDPDSLREWKEIHKDF
jgi:hypothetical protein